MSTAADNILSSNAMQRLHALRSTLGARCTAIIIALAGFAVIIPEILDYPKPYIVDFHFFWAAGEMWFNGASPYGAQYEDFLRQHEILNGLDNKTRPFFYPPNAILLCGPLGAFDERSAWFVVSFTNLSALALSSWLFGRLCRVASVSTTILYPALIHFGFIGVGWSIGKHLFVFGQPILVVYAGFLLLMIGALEKRTVPMAVGLTLCLLKPQIGVPLAFACLLHPASRTPALIAGAATTMLCIIGLLPGGIIESVQNFLAGFRLYAEFPENAPGRLSGVGYVVHLLFDAQISMLLLLAASLASIAWAAARTSCAGVNLLNLICFALIASLFFLPSHNNYYISLTAAMVWIAREPLGRDKWLLGAFFLLTQSLSLGSFLSDVNKSSLFENVALIDTIAITVIFAISAKCAMHEFLVPNEPGQLIKSARPTSPPAP